MSIDTKASGASRERAPTVRPDPIHPEVRRQQVVDTDFHFSPTWESLRKYLREPFRSRLYSYPMTSTEINPECANGKAGGGQDTMGSARTAEDILRVLDENGTDRVVINPGMNRPQSMLNAPVIAAVSAAYNDLLIHEVFPASDRISAALMICHRDPVLGADEIRRVGHHEKFVSFYTEVGGCYESLGSAKFDPIFDAAKDMDNLPMTGHAGGFQPHFSPLWESARTWTELFGNMTSAHGMIHVGAFVMQGLFDKYPDLKILLQEVGFYWMPDISARLDDFYMSHPHDVAMCERMEELGRRFLAKLPSEYIEDHIRFSTQPMPIPKSLEDWRMLLKLCRADKMFCYSSDWPHQTFDPANWVVEHPDILDKAAQKKILADNARALYPRLG